MAKPLTTSKGDVVVLGLLHCVETVSYRAEAQIEGAPTQYAATAWAVEPFVRVVLPAAIGAAFVARGAATYDLAFAGGQLEGAR